MKKVYFLLFALILVFSNNVFAQKKGKKETAKVTPVASAKLYDSKSGKLVYKMDFMGEQTYTLYWDNFGDKEAKIMKVDVEMFGQKSSTETVELKMDGFLYKYEVGKNTGTKTKANSSLGGAQGFPKDVSKMAQKEIDKMKIVDLGTKEILGKTCKGLKMEPMGMKMEAWIWGNLALESKTWLSKNGEPIEMKAVSLELDVTIPPEIFKVPEGVEFTEY
jgi:hypothetical protein